MTPTSRLDSVISLCKRRGFVFPAGEIYGGTRSAWDYGPLGVELKENVKKQWWRSVVTEREDIVGLDSAVILPRQVWVASGHVNAFNDPLTECACHRRSCRSSGGGFRGPEGPYAHRLEELPVRTAAPAAQWTEPRDFNMMLKTYLGAVDESGLHYHVPRLPGHLRQLYNGAGHAQAAARHRSSKSFQRDHARGHLPTREFEQMEMGSSSSPAPMRSGISTSSAPGGTPTSADAGEPAPFRAPQGEALHYRSALLISISVGFIGGDWGELEGAANRNDFDLDHSELSDVELSYFDPTTGERYIPYVIEPAAGPNRAMMAFLVDAYDEDEAPNTKGGVDKRTVLRLDPRLAPVKVAVLPLSRNESLSPKARDLASRLRQSWNVDFDDAQAIGRRYRRQDEIGTPYCVTIDFDTLNDQAVTVRERDSMTQERVSEDKVMDYLPAAARLLTTAPSPTDLSNPARL